MSSLFSRKRVVATSIIALLTLWVSCAAASAQVELVIREEYKPGKLESFLVATPSATLVQKEFGKFISPTTATFTAIVASDPVTKVTLSGLEVRFQGTDQTITVYLDEDCIKRLQKSVASLEKSQQFAQEHLREKSSADLATPHVTIAYNDSTKFTNADGQTETAAILHVGYYGYDGGFGVYLAPVWGVDHHGAQFYYQTASLSDLSKILSATSSFLSSN